MEWEALRMIKLPIIGPLMVMVALSLPALAQTDQAQSKLKAARGGLDAGSGAIKCLHNIEQEKGLFQVALDSERLSEKLEPLSTALMVIHIQSLRESGRTAEANEELTRSTLDAVICKVPTTGVCGSWMVGRTVGNLLDELPKYAGVTDSTITELWAVVLADELHPDPTEDDIERMIVYGQRRLHAARVQADQHAQVIAKVRCDVPKEHRPSAARRTPMTVRPLGTTEPVGVHTEPIAGACIITGTCN